MSDGSNNIPLEKYIERILEERKDTLILTAQRLEERLSHLNALREELLRDRSTYVPREVYNVLVNRVNAIERCQAKTAGIGLVILAASGFVGALIMWLVKGQS